MSLSLVPCWSWTRPWWAGASCSRTAHQRNDMAYRQLEMKMRGQPEQIIGGFHMDKRPMILLGTADSSAEAPKVMQRRVLMSQAGDMVHWQGELEQPNVHYIYWKFFSTVDIHNKLAVGPRSVKSVGANHLLLQIWLTMVASV